MTAIAQPLPCPWCHSEPRIYDSYTLPSSSVVECTNHDCPMPDEAATAQFQNYMPHDDAIANWNRRVAADARS